MRRTETSPDYTRLTKKLTLPVGAAAPRRLVYNDLVATAISRSDLADDVRGINASLALIQQTRGGTWPTEPVSEDYDFVDLVWHEFEFREGSSFPTSSAMAPAPTSGAATSTRWAAARR